MLRKESKIIDWKDNALLHPQNDRKELTFLSRVRRKLGDKDEISFNHTLQHFENRPSPNCIVHFKL